LDLSFQLITAASIVTALSAAVSILIVASQRWHGKHTLDHDLTGVQKFHATAVPRIGGLAIVLSIACALLLCDQLFAGMFSPRRFHRAWLLIAAGIPAFVAGIIEDLTKKVSVQVRLVASISSALAASCLLGATIDGLDIWGVDRLLTWFPFALAITAITVSGGVNAINIIDGFNGLAAGTVLIMLCALGMVAHAVGDIFVMQLAIFGGAAALGFLFVNYPNGRLFLGDGGAYFLGFWVAEIVVLLLVRNPKVNAWQLLSICAYPVIEVGFSIYRRKVIRQMSPGAPDGLHLHTLVYRRLVPRLFTGLAQPWQKNAAVGCVMLPGIAVASFMSVMSAGGIALNIAIVAAQVLIYLVLYARLVRGRWLSRREPATTAPLGGLDDLLSHIPTHK
jgi:UDP-N-acetylmuramyl pentapeptide phosphotransferase/UDP-N-acetylglucosamine-1-phosphate transferase